MAFDEISKEGKRRREVKVRSKHQIADQRNTHWKSEKHISEKEEGKEECLEERYVP